MRKRSKNFLININFSLSIHSLDSRGGSLKLAAHSALASDLGQRLYFAVSDSLKESRLQIRNVQNTDGGVYRCRVDFFNSPTRNFRVNLTLIGKYLRLSIIMLFCYNNSPYCNNLQGINVNI